MDIESTLFLLSEKKPMYNGLFNHLKKNNTALHPCHINDIKQLHKFQPDLNNCELVLCDAAENSLFIEESSRIIEIMPIFIPIIAIQSSNTISERLLQQASALRLAGVVDIKKGWEPAWNSILKLQQIWNSPIMHSRIEDVSPSDVLQMIGVSQWTSMVRLEGYTDFSDTKQNNGQARILGCISFNKGVPECAWSTHHVGNEAIFELLSLNHGTLDVIRHPWSSGVCNVTNKMEEILITYALKIDESPHNKHKATKNESHEVGFLENLHDEIETSEPVALFQVMESKAVWPDFGRHQVLDPWWNRHKDEIAQIMTSTGSKRFPLRWMDWKELRKLATQKEQVQFIIMAGEQEHVIRCIELYAQGFDRKKLSGDELPVIRFGKINGRLLYLVVVTSFVSSLQILNKFPFIVCSGESHPEEVLIALHQLRYRTALFISPEPSSTIAQLKEVGEHVSTSYCCIPLLQPDLQGMQQMILRIIDTIAEMSSEVKA